MTLDMQESTEAEYISAPAAARILGFKDGRTAIRLAELGEIKAYRLKGERTRWRFDKASVEAARDRYFGTERLAS